MTVDKSEISVGDRVVATLVYAWPTGWTPVVEPDPAGDLSGVFVADLPPVKSQDTGEGSRRSFTITLVSTRSGAWELPRPSFTVRPPAGDAVTVQAPQVVVQVGLDAAPVTLPAPRPAWTKPAAAPPPPWWPWLAGGGVLLAIGAVVWWKLRPKRLPDPPISLARRALAAAGELPDARESGTAISLALRRYAGAIWTFDGAGATTREAAAHLRQLGSSVPANESTELLRLLGVLDDLRWAPGEVTADQVKPQLTAALAWIEAVQRRLDAAEQKREP
ncbi:hypothetical protein LBMAG53_19490 [Planctomycetota bacterium]|nr:hypothetical protein LBMAG53_19490 [Planctomycetota bacterium]